MCLVHELFGATIQVIQPQKLTENHCGRCENFTQDTNDFVNVGTCKIKNCLVYKYQNCSLGVEKDKHAV